VNGLCPRLHQVMERFTVYPQGQDYSLFYNVKAAETLLGPTWLLRIYELCVICACGVSSLL